MSTPDGSRPARTATVGRRSTRVLVAGRDEGFIAGIAQGLRGSTGPEMVGGATSRSEAVDLALLLEPDVFVVDIGMEREMGGLEVALAVRRKLPATAFLVVSPFSDDDHIAVFPIGLGLPWSFILAESARDPATLSTAVSQAAWGLRYIDPKVDARKLGARDWEIGLAVRDASAPNGAGPGDGSGDRTRWHGVIQTFRLPLDPRAVPAAGKERRVDQDMKDLMEALRKFPALRFKDSSAYAPGTQN